MAEHQVTFAESDNKIVVTTGTLLSEAAQQAGVELNQPCGGQGRCGRCAVRVTDESGIRRRSTLRLTSDDVAAGYALACQTVVEGNTVVFVPPQEKIERRLTTDLTAAAVTVPADYCYRQQQTVRRFAVEPGSPSMDDQTDDFSRLQTALRQQEGIGSVRASLPLLRKLGAALRDGDWQVTVVVDTGLADHGDGPARIVDISPGVVADDSPLWGVAVDIGTTTVTVWLVDLMSGEVKGQAAEYNRQIKRGEDVISRIIYAGKSEGSAAELRDAVVDSIGELIVRVCRRAGIEAEEIVKATIAGNSTMMHLFLQIPASSIRLMPFVTAVNHVPALRAEELGLPIHPDATVDCLPGVASYVGADISAGVLSSGMDDSDAVTLFMDIGTNGETVLGNRDWLITCACSAGPAFEGAGVLFGMRATRGAIEEVWVNGETLEPSYRVIGGGPPRGFCGSGLISLLAELFLTGVIDKGGNINQTLTTPRVRSGEHGAEYVVAWKEESATAKDIVITRVDIDNLLRAKAAIYAGFSVLAHGVGLPLDAVERVLIGGAFGKYINVEKAVEIGLLPDMPWDNFHFLGNTAVRGAYLALLQRQARQRIRDIALRMTYVELSADNSFYDAFTSALFLPHTDMTLFPTVEATLRQGMGSGEPQGQEQR